MSATLIYRLPAKEHRLSDAMKFAIRDTFPESGSGWVEIDDYDISFFRGVAAAGNDELKKEAEFVIALIEKHDKIEMRLEH